MASPTEQTLAKPEAPVIEDEEEEEEQNEQSEEWETMAQAWVSSFPEAKAVSMEEVEAWIDSNFDFIPDGIKSMPRSDVCHRLIAIQNCMRSAAAAAAQEKEEQHGNEQDVINVPHARFQRTDQWKPVYTWLESLDTDTAVNSNDITEWLTSNPDIQEFLYSRHTKYHLMHYIKKCHTKIIKRRDMKRGVQRSETPASLKVDKDVEMKYEATPPSTNLIPQDSDLYMMKRKEALEKFQILVELEKLLAPTFLKPEVGNERFEAPN